MGTRRISQGEGDRGWTYLSLYTCLPDQAKVVDLENFASVPLLSPSGILTSLPLSSSYSIDGHHVYA